MRSEHNARSRGTEGISSLWRLVGAALAVLCLALILWVAGHVHPEITTVSAQPPAAGAAPGSSAGTGVAVDLSGRFAQAVDNELRIAALEQFLKKQDA